MDSLRLGSIDDLLRPAPTKIGGIDELLGIRKPAGGMPIDDLLLRAESEGYPKIPRSQVLAARKVQPEQLPKSQVMTDYERMDTERARQAREQWGATTMMNSAIRGISTPLTGLGYLYDYATGSDVGQSFDAALSTSLPVSPDRQDSIFYSHLPNALGNILSMALPASGVGRLAATGKVGAEALTAARTGFAVTSGLQSFTTGAGHGYREALMRGVEDPEAIFKGMVAKGLIEATDVIPTMTLLNKVHAMPRFLSILSRAVPPAKSAIPAVIRGAFNQAMIEGAQEQFQNYTSDMVSNELFGADYDTGLGRLVPGKQEIAAAIAGGIMGGMGTAHSKSWVDNYVNQFLPQEERAEMKSVIREVEALPTLPPTEAVPMEEQESSDILPVSEYSTRMRDRSDYIAGLKVRLNEMRGLLGEGDLPANIYEELKNTIWETEMTIRYEEGKLKAQESIGLAHKKFSEEQKPKKLEAISKVSRDPRLRELIDLESQVLELESSGLDTDLPEIKRLAAKRDKLADDLSEEYGISSSKLYHINPKSSKKEQNPPMEAGWTTDEQQKNMLPDDADTLEIVPPGEAAIMASTKIAADAMESKSRTAAISNYLADHTYLKHYWDRLGFGKIGEALRSNFSIIGAFEEYGLRTIYKLRRMSGFDKDLDPLAILIAEDPTSKYLAGRLAGVKDKKNISKITDVSQEMISGFKKAKAKAAEYGVKMDFKSDIISDIDTIKKRLLKKVKAGKITQSDYITEMLSLNLQRKVLDRLEYVHIPYEIWWPKIQERLAAYPRKQAKQLKERLNVARRTMSISDLLDAGLIDESDLSIPHIMYSYYHKFGQDMALANLIRAGREEGLVINNKTADFKAVQKFLRKSSKDLFDIDNIKVLYPSIKSLSLGNTAAYKGVRIHRAYLDRINDLYKLHEPGTWRTILNRAKSLAFYNPFILTTNNLFQTLFAVGPSIALNPIKLGKDIRRAFKESWEMSDNYMEALEAGMASMPYVSPFMSGIEIAELYGKSMRQHLPEGVKTFVKSGFGSWKGFGGLFTMDTYKHLYGYTNEIAWGLDKVMRYYTYNKIREHHPDMAVKDAAQVTAMFMGDYANVDPKLRNALNHVLFTPTFKISMAHLYKHMAEQFVRKYSSKVVDVGQYNKTPSNEVYAAGMTRLIALSVAFDTIMTQALGFDREEFGRKYSKKVTGTNAFGMPEEKELVHVYSSPMNIISKYVSRAINSFTAPNTDGFMLNFLKENKFELHPIYRVPYEIIANKGKSGEPIVNPFDSVPEKTFKKAKYFYSNIVSLIDFFLREGQSAAELVGMKVPEVLQTTSPGQVEADRMSYNLVPKHQVLSKILGLTSKTIMSGFRYTRSAPEKRAFALMMEINNDLRRQIKKSGGKISQGDLKRYRAHLQKAIDIADQ